MTRITTSILIIMLLMNGTVTVMSASGLSADIGVELAPGIDKQMGTVTTEMKQGFNPQIGVVESLLSLITAALSIFGIVVTGVYALPAMLLNLGFPAWIVTPLVAPMYVIATLELIYLATGRDTI